MLPLVVKVSHVLDLILLELDNPSVHHFPHLPDIVCLGANILNNPDPGHLPGHKELVHLEQVMHADHLVKYQFVDQFLFRMC